VDEVGGRIAELGLLIEGSSDILVPDPLGIEVAARVGRSLEGKTP
jgi:hypothetical protein